MGLFDYLNPQFQPPQIPNPLDPIMQMIAEILMKAKTPQFPTGDQASVLTPAGGQAPPPPPAANPMAMGAPYAQPIGPQMPPPPPAAAPTVSSPEPLSWYQDAQGTWRNKPSPTPLEAAPDYSNPDVYTPPPVTDTSQLSGTGIGGMQMTPDEMERNYNYNQMYGNLAGSGVPYPEAAATAAEYVKSIDKNAGDTSIQRAQIAAEAKLKSAGIQSVTDKYVSDNAKAAKDFATTTGKDIANDRNAMIERIKQIEADTRLTAEQRQIAAKFATQADALGNAKYSVDQAIDMAMQVGSKIKGGLADREWTQNDVQNLANQISEQRKKFKDDKIKQALTNRGIPEQVIDKAFGLIGK